MNENRSPGNRMAKLENTGGRLVYIAGVTALVLLLNGCMSVAIQRREALSSDLQPDPKYTPAEVVRIQMTAFQFNDTNDQGIEVAFRFASPANRRTTGPLPRFSQLIKTTEYRPMLNHISVEYDDIFIRGRRARQRITLIGPNNAEAAYVFFLSYQIHGSCGGCWMTDAVIAERKSQSNRPNFV